MSAGHEEQRVGTDDPDPDVDEDRRAQSVEHVDGSIRVEVPDESKMIRRTLTARPR